MDKPINKVDIFNTALPAADTDFLTSDIKPTLDPGILRVYVTLSIAGVFYVSRTVAAATVTELLNSGVDLTAGCAYAFSVAWKAGESINFKCTTTGGTINKLQVDESWS